MEDFLFTILVRGKLTAYSEKQIVDHFTDGGTQRSLRGVLGFYNSSIKLTSLIRIVDTFNDKVLKRPIYANNDFVGEVTQIRDKIAQKLYVDHMKVVSNYIHNLGLQIIALQSVREGWMTTHAESIKLSAQYKAEILGFESKYGYNFPGYEGAWGACRSFRYYSDYSFKWRSITDLSQEDLDPFLSVADSIIHEFSHFFFLEDIESKIKIEGIECLAQDRPEDIYKGND